MEKQSNNIIFQLLDDDLFIQWIISPTPELDLYWQKQIESNEELKNNIHILKNIIKRLEVKEEDLTSDEKRAIWNKIDASTINKKHPKKQININNAWRRIASLAAAVVLIVISYWFITQYTPQSIDYKSIVENDEIQSENVTLILPNQKKIRIESDSSQVIYDNKGNVNVNSEQIEDTKSQSIQLNQLIVPFGKTSFLTLSDGTKVWVNSGSKIVYPSVFDKKKREIFVLGEVFLDVAKDDKCPFIIKTNYIDINVLGTTLNVSAYGNEPLQTVVLVTGSVSINNKDDNARYKIHPNQLYSYDLTSNEADIKTINVDNYISWVNGYLSLQYESLDKVLLKLDRHYNTTTTYNVSEIKNIRVSGKLDLKENIETVLNYISITAPIKYEVKDKEVIVTLSN